MLYSLPISTNQKILLLRFSAIGDIVLTSPIIRCLKKQLGAEIHYLTKENYRSIVHSNPYVDKVYTINKRVGEVLPLLRQEKYDYLIDLHKNLRTLLIKAQLPFIKTFTFNKLNIEKWLLVNFKINRLPKKHLVDRYFEGLQSLGIINDGQGLDFFISQNRTALPVTLPNEYKVLVIGAGRATKSLTTERLATIINKCVQPVVLLGGPAEVRKAAEIVAQTKKSVHNLVGQLTLEQSAYCVQQAKVVITGDTGLMHIAAAFQKPIYSIWGNTVPEFGMYPYYGASINQNKTLEVKNLSCRPCSKIGFDKCPKGHFKCMVDLDVDKIIDSSL